MDVHFYTTIVEIALFLLLHLFSCACSSCDWCPRHSTASLFPPTADPSYGACGYGAMAMELNGGYIAAASGEVFNGGDGCGGCYELRCRDRRVCKEDGVKVVVTDEVNGEVMNRTGFVLSKEAFMALAKEMSHQLMRLETVDVDFRRIPCEYKNKNLAIRVEEMSKHPSHLALKFLYQGGQTDIAAVEVARVGSMSWQYMTRDKGRPIWRTSRAPPGPLQLRFVVTAGSGGKWVRSEEEVLPSHWRSGEIYDTGVRITDVAMHTCLACAKEELR